MNRFLLAIIIAIIVGALVYQDTTRREAIVLRHIDERLSTMEVNQKHYMEVTDKFIAEQRRFIEEGKKIREALTQRLNEILTSKGEMPRSN